MKLLTIILVILLAAIGVKTRLFSFSSQSPKDYSQTGPLFVLDEHLSGPILSEGIIYGPTGKVGVTFVANMVGTWDGDSGTLAESFSYSNGKTQKRKWFLKRVQATLLSLLRMTLLAQLRVRFRDLQFS
jgi:hypothetical protein